jgi:gliding motility-associated-like protein
VYENLSSDCGHLDILDVVFAAPDTTWIDEQICISDSILFNGQYHSLSGQYTMASQNTLGCDSIVILVLNVVETLMETDTVKLCAMDSVEIFGDWIHSDTTLQQTMTASSGCDSTQRFIIVSGAIESNLQFQLCPGDSIHLYNSWYQEDGNYQLVIANAEGCDSIIRLDIFVSDTMNTSEDILLCPGDSLWLNGDWISSEGEYKTIISSATGCDSTHTVSVRYVEDPPSPQTAIDCEEMKIILSIDLKSGWIPIWSNGDTTFQSSFSNGVLEAGLTLHHQPNCAKQLSITLPVLPDAGDIPILADTIIQTGQTLIVDLGLDAREWSVRWSSHQIVSCDTCMTVEIMPIENTEIFIDLQHESGCYYETSFIIRLQEEDEGIYFPNIFSPNGDQHNDVWMVFASDDIQLRAISVFDRWGNVVYVGTGEQIGWDGSFRGQLCAPGVYVYMIEYVDGLGTLKTVAGDLTLIR